MGMRKVSKSYSNPSVNRYDNHGNVTKMEHLSSLEWDYKDQLISTTNGTFTSYYNYDSEGNRSRKVVENGNIREEKYYIGGYEIYKHFTNLENDYERETIKIADDIKTFVLIETKSTIEIENGEIVKTLEPPIIRYQYDNHLGSACLELDNNANIISYEEYHPFGTTSYRAGRSETEVSLKRYKYCGKERDEESGLYYYGARYYAAWLCRWISTDPLKEETPNSSSYVYCLDNPIKYVDPDGRKPKTSVSVSEDGSKVTISITNTAYVYSRGKKAQERQYNQSEIDKYLRSGQIQLGDKTVDINIETNMINVKNKREARKRIDENEGFGVIVKNSSYRGKSKYFGKAKYDFIKMKEQNLHDKNPYESVLAHELSHDLGFADKYVQIPFKGDFPIKIFKYSLMGGMNPLSDYELAIIASDIIDNDSINIKENDGYPVIYDLDRVPKGEVTTVTEFDNEEIPESQIRTKNVKITNPVGTPIGDIIKNKIFR